MATDHSLTYRKGGIRNVGHRHRLKSICATVEGIVGGASPNYADVGCSNGYVTDHVRIRLGLPTADAFDYLAEHFEVGGRLHPALNFHQLSITDSVLPRRYQLVTCFETLEHVGDVRAAVRNLFGSLEPGGQLLVSVPIEHGFRGLIKYAVKRGLYGYSLAELPEGEAASGRYLRALITGGRIDGFRESGRSGWGTHFGFDTRTVEDAFTSLGVFTRSWSSLFTRFFVARCPAAS